MTGSLPSQPQPCPGAPLPARRALLSSAFRQGLAAAAVGCLPAAQVLAQPAEPLTRIAFGSCADEEAPQPIWDAVLGYRPQLFVFAGDNVYGDYRNGRQVAMAQSIEALRESYEQAAQVPGFNELRRRVKHLAIWDDHDYGRNDAGVEFPYKEQSKQLFLQFWQVPDDDPRRRRDGLYHAATYGPPGMRVQVILLDTRWFRSALKRTDQRDAPGRERYIPDDDPARTMLGDAQWAWLEQQLREPAELRLVVSSIQVLAEGHGWERWGNFPREAARLRALISDTRAGGVVLLSGDRHIGALYRADDGLPYPVTEITSSGINRVYPGNREAGPNRLGAVFGAANFGAIDVDWWARTVTLSLRNEAGEAVRRVDLKLDELRAR